jgi:hypothetical protein
MDGPMDGPAERWAAGRADGPVEVPLDEWAAGPGATRPTRSRSPLVPAAPVDHLGEGLSRPVGRS